jgi:hypothetical protein
MRQLAVHGRMHRPSHGVDRRLLGTGLYGLQGCWLECVRSQRQPSQSYIWQEERHEDSEQLAYLFKAELTKASYIPSREHQDLRTLTRVRVRLVETETDFKNRAHKVLHLCDIRLACKLSDLFGGGGLRILEALLNGKDIDDGTRPQRYSARRPES